MSLISADALAACRDDPGVRILDARFSLADADAGRAAYRAGHIPGAHYLDLESDLSGPKTDPRLGRHPLPPKAHWQAVLEGIGFLDPAAPKKLMPRLQQLLNRAQLREEELHILRGIARAVQAAAHHGDHASKDP